MKMDDRLQGNVTLNSTLLDSWKDETPFKNLKYMLALESMQLKGAKCVAIYRTPRILTTSWPYKCHTMDRSSGFCLDAVRFFFIFVISWDMNSLEGRKKERLLLKNHTTLWILGTLKLLCICKNKCSDN